MPPSNGGHAEGSEGDFQGASNDVVEDVPLSWSGVAVTLYYGLVNLSITLGSLGLLLTAHWLYMWANCKDCCCNSCNRGSSYCAFPRFHGEDLGDETRNFVFWMGVTGIINFFLSYSIWANYGSPRIFLLVPALSCVGLLAWKGMSMKWLLCHPVERPQNNLANWISMPTLNTEHGRVAMFALAVYAAILFLDLLMCMVCCCCIEQVEETDDNTVGKQKQE